MQPFEYARPHSLQEAAELLHSHTDDAAVLAGGTDLIVQMQKGVRTPAVVIDLKHVVELDADIEPDDGRLRVGAKACLADIESHPEVRKRFPALAEAVGVIGSVQIRNRATLVGNICNASPAADTAPPLLVYEARVNVFGPEGRHAVPMDHFFAGPGRTVLGDGELVESVDLPLPNEANGSAFHRLARRRGMDLASVSVACCLSASGHLRLAFGAAGPTPILVTDQARVFLEEGPCRAAEERLDELARSAQPISDVRAGEDYRRAMVCVLSHRCLRTARRRMEDSE